jgi:competence protein ComEA
MKRQMDGLIIVVMITAAIVLSSYFLAQRPSADVQISHSDSRGGPVIVKLAGQTDRGGIYYLPERTAIAGLLEIAGVQNRERFDSRMLDTPLLAGQTVTVSSEKRLEIGAMNAAERLALDMPIDINQATLDELMLVSGIGERTAEKIVAFRKGRGPFRTIDDLMQIPGIKDKKLSRLKQYFFIGKPAGIPRQP